MTIAEQIKILEEKLAGIDEPRERADIILEILTCYLRMRSSDAQPYVDKLLRIAEDLGDDLYRARALFHQSVVARHAGDNVAALRLAEWSLDLFKQEKYMSGIADCYNNIGNIHQFQGNLGDALKNHLSALRIRQEIGDKAQIALSQNNIAIVYYTQGNMAEALENNFMVLATMRELGEKQGIANALINIGNVYHHEGNHEEALIYYRECLDIHQQTGNKYGIAGALCNIGDIHYLMGNYGDALEYSVPSLKMFEEIGSKDGQALVLNNIGKVYTAQEEYGYALDTQLRSLQLCEEIGSKEEARSACRDLTETYRGLGDYESALKYYMKYHEYDTEMVGQQAQKQMIQLRFQHDIEMKDREAQLLKEKNDVINLYAQKLEVSNNELKQFANIASHDLREPLRMVSSYMTLLEKTLGDDINPTQKQFIGFAVDGAKRMENLILDLLRLAKVDANPRIEEVPLPSIVDDVRSNLEILLREKSAEIISAPLPTISADRTQVMQLFQNIIGNGIKYNENPTPTISIGFELRDTDALLSIADNGIGIPKDYREKAFQLFQRVPTAKQYQGTGIGLAICKKLVDGWGGTIAIEDNPGGGSVFLITIPKTLII